MPTFIEKLRAAIAAGTGIIGVSSRDLPDTIRQIVKFFGENRPVLRWNCNQGINANFSDFNLGMNKLGENEVIRLACSKALKAGAKIEQINIKEGESQLFLQMPTGERITIDEVVSQFQAFTRSYYESLNKASELIGYDPISRTPGAILIYERPNSYKSEPNFISAITNLRDSFAATKRVLILVDNQVEASSQDRTINDIKDDIWFIKHDLPKSSEVTSLFSANFNALSVHIKNRGIKIKDLTEIEYTRATKALVGLSSYQIEQVTSITTVLQMSQLAKDGVFDIETFIKALFNKKKELLQSIQGLKLSDVVVNPEKVGGFDFFKDLIASYANGKKKYGCIVLFDEMDKFFGATGASNENGGNSGVTDTSGVTTEMIGKLCSWMDNPAREEKIDGVIALGVPGTGKSLCAYMTAHILGVPLIEVSLPSMKGSLVGQSNQALEKALDTIDAISDGVPFCIATCNSSVSFPPEIIRRFGDILFFDCQDPDSVWPIYENKYQVKRPAKREIYEKFTPAEVARMAENASNRNISCEKVRILPQATSRASQIEQLHRACIGKYICATTGEPWTPRVVKPVTTENSKDVKTSDARTFDF